MLDLYQEVILQHYRSPKNFGALDGATAVGAESNPLCGDHIEIRLRIDPSGGRLEEVRFTGDGCAISMASASMMTEKIKGEPMERVRAMTQEDVLKLLGIPLSPVRIKCALTPFVALGRALGSAGSAPGPTGASSGSVSA